MLQLWVIRGPFVPTEGARELQAGVVEHCYTHGRDLEPVCSFLAESELAERLKGSFALLQSPSEATLTRRETL